MPESLRRKASEAARIANETADAFEELRLNVRKQAAHASELIAESEELLERAASHKRSARQSELRAERLNAGEERPGNGQMDLTDPEDRRAYKAALARQANL